MNQGNGENPQSRGLEVPVGVREKLERTSGGPGVYLMRDAAGKVIYVGKARNLKKRLANYFAPAGPVDPKTAALVARVADLDTVLTASEKEALILESNLIKQHRPRYNVVLKDDKRYPMLRLGTDHPYPRLSVVRRFQDDGAVYFGPYASAAAVRTTLAIINKLFKLRKCREGEFARRTRPCLHYQMGACYGPCCLAVDRQRYAAAVREVMLFLNGRTPELIRAMRREMLAAAAAEDFEAAASIRDRIFALEKTLEKQVAVIGDRQDRDVLAVGRAGAAAVVTLVTVRGGYWVGTRHFDVSAAPAGDEELLAGFIRQYYRRGVKLPGEILLSAVPEDAVLIADWLGEIRGRRVRLLHPRRSEKLRLVHMAQQNAQAAAAGLSDDGARREALLAALARRLQLVRPPRRIECVDISTSGGSQSVGAIAVFVDGKPKPDAYRRYRIRSARGPDDYAAMAEVLGRRFRATGDRVDLPDLLLVDGGKGQLNIASRVLAELGWRESPAIAAIAKADHERGETEDKIFLPGRVNPVQFGRNPAPRLLLEAVRDEAHRFVIGFHRRRRRKEALVSVLDGVAGIGPARKRRLLKHFGTMDSLRRASVEQLAAAGLPHPVALALHRRLAATTGGAYCVDNNSTNNVLKED
ncbi:MAG TPA: excinuclease ABC subunit UvrC [Desulfobacteraceae bacterium]|nr:excinuclease ABC subunit UvrC [Desulfobacteraceae bacterium]